MLADMPHYYKLLRDHFLDESLVLDNGIVVDSDILLNFLRNAMEKFTLALL